VLSVTWWSLCRRSRPLVSQGSAGKPLTGPATSRDHRGLAPVGL
jgi:hypothetical protein